MRWFISSLCLAFALSSVGCTKSVESERRDVNQAVKNRDEKVEKDLRKAQDDKMDGDKKIIEEQRDVRDAAKRVNDRNGASPTAP
jgi:hypothetical protein